MESPLFVWVKGDPTGTRTQSAWTDVEMNLFFTLAGVITCHVSQSKSEGDHLRHSLSLSRSLLYPLFCHVVLTVSFLVALFFRALLSCFARIHPNREFGIQQYKHKPKKDEKVPVDER